MKITNQPREIDGRKSEVIAFIVNAGAIVYGWPSYSQLIIFTSSENIFTSGKTIFTGSRNKTLAKATHN